MKAVRVHQWGTPPVVDEVPDPDVQPGHSLVRVRAATVGHLDRTIWSGRFLRPPALPYTPGVEGSGEVLGSSTFPVGTRVWIRGGGLGTALDGTWAEFVSAPDASLGVLPDGVGFEVGSAFFSPCTSAWVALHGIGRIDAGHSIVVTGATGAVGSVAVQLAQAAGARVLAVVSTPSAVGRLPGGVDGATLDTWDPGDVGADLLVDTVGGPVLEAALPAVRPGGKAVIVGYVAGTTLAIDLPAFVQHDVSLHPLNMVRREAEGRAAAPELLARLRDGTLRLETTAFALDDAARALDWITERCHSGRAVVVPDRRRARR